MARINNGIMGSFSGRVGTVVGYTRYGSSFMRSLPKKILKAPSEAQLKNRRAMAAAMTWLKPIKAYVRIGYQSYSDRQHGFGSAVSFIKKHALRENKTVDASLAMISCGDLPEPKEVEVNNTEPGILHFTWKAVKNNTDRVLILAYADADHIDGDLGGARRMAGEHILHCGNIVGMEADIYIAFVSEERDMCSNSVYLGRILVE